MEDNEIKVLYCYFAHQLEDEANHYLKQGGWRIADVELCSFGTGYDIRVACYAVLVRTKKELSNDQHKTT